MKIIQFFKVLDKKIEVILASINVLTKEKQVKPEIELIRTNLGSINLRNIKLLDEMSQDARKDYVARVASLYEPVILPALKKMIETQMEFSVKQSENWEQVIFARGAINGLSLFDEEMRQCVGEHLANVQNSKNQSDES